MNEFDVIKYVQKHARWYRAWYAVSWGDTSYMSDEPRGLVIQICKAEGIEVK